MGGPEHPWELSIKNPPVPFNVDDEKDSSPATASEIGAGLPSLASNTWLSVPELLRIPPLVVIVDITVPLAGIANSKKHKIARAQRQGILQFLFLDSRVDYRLVKTPCGDWRWRYTMTASAAMKQKGIDASPTRHDYRQPKLEEGTDAFWQVR